MRRGKIGSVFLLLAVLPAAVAVACGDDDTVPSPTPAPTTTSTSTNDAAPASEAGAETGSSPDSGESNRCITSSDCEGLQCQPDGQKNYANVPTGTCVTSGTCKFIGEDGTRPTVDAQCTDVVPCLGFVCVPTGIVPGPTGIFACGLPGQACLNEDGSRCCYSECPTDGMCPAL